MSSRVTLYNVERSLSVTNWAEHFKVFHFPDILGGENNSYLQGNKQDNGTKCHSQRGRTRLADRGASAPSSSCSSQFTQQIAAKSVQCDCTLLGYWAITKNIGTAHVFKELTVSLGG